MQSFTQQSVARINGEVNWLRGVGDDISGDKGMTIFIKHIDTPVIRKNNLQLSTDKWVYEGKKMLCCIFKRD